MVLLQIEISVATVAIHADSSLMQYHFSDVLLEWCLLIVCHLLTGSHLTLQYLLSFFFYKRSPLTYIFHTLFFPSCSKSFTTGSVSRWVAGDTLLRRCNPGPVLPSVPWQFEEYEPSPKETRRLSHTAGGKSPLYPPSSSTPLSPALTPHLNSKVRLFISLPHPIKGSWYKRMKLDFLPGYWRIRSEVEAAVSDVCEPRWGSSRCKDKIGGKPTLWRSGHIKVDVERYL